MGKKQIKKESIKWNQELKNSVTDFVCAEIEMGKSLREIFRESLIELPARKEFYRWINENELFCNQYARACELRAENIFEEIIEISDDSGEDITIDEMGIPRENREFVSRSRLRVDARKWVLSKMNPKKYGEKLDITSDNKHILDFKDMSDEDLDRELSDLS